MDCPKCGKKLKKVKSITRKWSEIDCQFEFEVIEYAICLNEVCAGEGNIYSIEDVQ